MSQPDFLKRFSGSAPQNYEKYFVAAIGRPLAQDLVETASLRAGERVLDVACGTGIVARLAAERVGSTGSVVGLDLNPGMLAVARSLTPSIEWHETSAESMPFQDQAFDVVLCQMGLQFVQDKPAALREVRRVLVPEGRFIFNVPGPTPAVFQVADEAFGRYLGPQAAGFIRMVFSLHDPAQIREMLAAAGYRNISVDRKTKKIPLPAPEDFLWQYIQSTPLTAMIQQTDEATRATMEKEIVDRWQNLVQDGALILDLDFTVANARH
jgi:ubiquinone/menaquinone biosynthesis C-methylase UbiE